MTELVSPYGSVDIISTHTLTWSVTFNQGTVAIEASNFNSHAHVERDCVGRIYRISAFCISTHTLTWSVTIGTGRNVLKTNFNSHAHVERDLMKLAQIYLLSIFQLTRSRGA